MPSDQPLITGDPAARNAADVAFANSMIQNHKQGIELSGLVPDRSTNSKVVAFAAARVSQLQSDLAILKVWLVQWNENPNADMSGGRRANNATGLIDQATVVKLNSLSGGKFDALWLESMSGLDQGAVEIADAEIAGQNNADVVGLAHQIVAERHADIGRIKLLLGG